MPQYEQEVILHDKDSRGHKCRLLRHSNGEIYLEVEAKHQGHVVFSTLRLGPAYELLPKLAPLR